MSRYPASSPSVLITRPEPAATQLSIAVRAMGLTAIVAPMLEIIPLSRPQRIGAIDNTDAEALIFISPAAVEFAAPQLQSAGIANKALFAVGSTTAAKIRQMFAREQRLIIHQPDDGFNSEALLALDALGPRRVAGQKILIIRGCGGRELLAEELTRRGAQVGYLEVYKRQSSTRPLAEILAKSGDKRPSIAVVTSVEGLKCLAQKIVSENLTHLLAMPILASGARIAREVPKLGFTNPPLIADNPTPEQILASLKRWIMEKL